MVRLQQFVFRLNRSHSLRPPIPIEACHQNERSLFIHELCRSYITFVSLLQREYSTDTPHRRNTSYRWVIRFMDTHFTLHKKSNTNSMTVICIQDTRVVVISRLQATSTCHSLDDLSHPTACMDVVHCHLYNMQVT
jgi:hypothetical protein